MNQDYLSVLNDEQREAVVHEGSPLLILAGAGSGKTRVITTKIAYLIDEKNVNPWQILAVTFTKKAANEMKERAIQLDERAASVQIKTFHSFGAWFLRKNAEAAGISENFTVYDDDDTVSLIQKCITEIVSKKSEKEKKEINATYVLSNLKTVSRHFAHQISLAKDYCFTHDTIPDDFLLELDKDSLKHNLQLAEVYQNYQNRLKETGNVDFGDLIMLPYLILKNDEDLRRRTQNRFKVIMVDEYQDSNAAQFLLLQELSGVKENSGNYICVVGDDDQSIYKFRGAEIQNILNFEKHFDGTTIIRLEKNYRSTSEILQVADDVVKNNEGRLGKTLVAERGKGNKPVVAFLKNQDEEAEEVVSLIKKAVKMGAKYSDWAILYRTNAQSLNFETYFMQNRIPYQVVGSLKFYEREEVKDLLAYISLLANPRDEIAFRRVVNKPARGIGSSSQDKIIDNARQSLLFDAENEIYSMPVDYVEACRKIAPTFAKKARDGALMFCDVIDEFREMLGIKVSSSDLKKSEEMEIAIEKSQREKQIDELSFDFGDEEDDDFADYTSMADESDECDEEDFEEQFSELLLKKEDFIEPLKIAELLTIKGFYRVPKVSAAGEFALKGEVLDIFYSEEKSTVRVNFDFDKIDSIKLFKLEDGSTIEELSEISIDSRLKKTEESTKSEEKIEEKPKRRRNQRLSVLIEDIIEKSGLKEYYESEDEISGTNKVANMTELMNSASLFSCTPSGLQEFLDHVQLDNTDDDDENADKNADENDVKNKVTLITLHNTKGLEFKRVVMTGMEHGIFPKIDKVGEELEEERRLCYVGMTRAKNSLYMTCCSARKMYGHLEFMDMSPFLREIDPNHIEIVCSKGQEQRKRQLKSKVHGKNGLSNSSFEDNSPLKKYSKGVCLYHDDYGYGEIIKGAVTESGEYKISVRFETGEIKNFLPKYSAKSLQIIKP